MPNPPQKSSAIQHKVIIAARFGSFLEWHDSLAFAPLATYFSVLFFPPKNPVATLPASLTTFGAGMLVKRRDYARELGVNAYLGKPYQEKELLQQVGAFVAHASAAFGGKAISQP